MSDLKGLRTWSFAELRSAVRAAKRQGAVSTDLANRLNLTDLGRANAKTILRNHRLWEIYLIRYADIAPSHVDRDADEIEHILPPDIIADLAQALAAESDVPPSPHILEARP